MTALVSASPTSRRQVRIAYALLGAALTTVTIAVATTGGVGLGPVAFWAVFPDLALLTAIGGAHEPGQLPRRTVPVYNTLHRPALPAAVFAGVAMGVAGTYWLVAALAWTAHISFDRASGYGLRTRDGWQRG